ncbi:MAG TPA: protein kinase [Candidatus Saccharimonadales bacterium]|nr:protein kinase [Candidatus Saccharimonadales bacterium]
MYPNFVKFNHQTKPKTILNFNQIFTISHFLGSGGYSQIFKIVDKKSKTPYALKVLKNIDQQTMNEVNILIELEKHPSIYNQVVHYHDHFVYQGKYCILMQYLEGQDAYVFYNNKSFDYQSFMTFSLWLFNIIDLLHHINIIHRDIKPNNIMVTKDGYKLIDFGLSCQLDKCQYINALTPAFAAPEIWNKQVVKNLSIYKASDVYAAGVTIYTMITHGHLPYDKIGTYVPIVHFNQIQNNAVNALMKHLIDKNYQTRYTASKAYDVLKTFNI